MVTSKKTGLLKVIFLSATTVAGSCLTSAGQTPAPTARPKVVVTPPTTSRVIVVNKVAPPQVVTILHKLNGLKVISILMSNEEIEAIANLDRDFELAGEVHTNVIAGVALDDGRTVAAWLPEAEAELPPRGAFAEVAPRTPRAPRVKATPQPEPDPDVPPTAPPTPVVPMLPPMPHLSLPSDLLQPADLKVITSDGRRIAGRYIGIDGITGLSLIALSNGNVSRGVDDKIENIVVGQKLRVIGPQRVPEAEAGTRSAVYIRIAETEATVVDVTRSPSGGLARVKIKSSKFSPANIGAVAISNDNETLGIVDAVYGTEATIVPLTLVRMAAKRVMARQASVPRPWLGIRGEPINAITLEKIMRTGWEIEKARALAEKQQGIMLTFVTPGSPAALAKLKVGDVILSVNNGFIRNAQELSFQLDEATPDNPVRFTIARPEKESTEAMEIKLSESPDPFFPRRNYKVRVPRIGKPVTLEVEGVETVALRPGVAGRFGSSGGLLVVSVEPTADAFKAGLRPGDVIEMIDGQPVYNGNRVSVSVMPGMQAKCTVVRNKEKITLTLTYSNEQDDQDKEKPEKEDKP